MTSPTPLALLFRSDSASPFRFDWHGIVFALLVGAAYWGFSTWRERRAQSWPVVQGTVEWTQVRVEGFGRNERTIPEVCYSYSVNGEYYAGSHEILRMDFDKYPKGSQILVHYKASDPSVSFLDLQDMRAHEDADEAIG